MSMQSAFIIEQDLPLQQEPSRKFATQLTEGCALGDALGASLGSGGIVGSALGLAGGC
jgi:hypothetical protein